MDNLTTKGIEDILSYKDLEEKQTARNADPRNETLKVMN